MPTLKTLETQIMRLEAKREQLMNKRRSPALAGIITTMKEYGITLEEVAAAFNGRAGTKRAKTKFVSTPPVKRAVKPKYRNEQTGETWSGRGKPPRWLSAAEAEGKTRESFLIV